MMVAMDAQDVRLILDELAQFVRREVEPRVSPWERTMDAAALQHLLGSVGELGVLPRQADDGNACESPALWSDPQDAQGMALSLGLLRELARGNAALALACHRRALRHWLLDELGFRQGGALPVDESRLALLTHGHYGLARGSLGQWLSGRSVLSRDDDALLADWLDRESNGSMLCAEPGWQGVLWPVWSQQTLQWALEPAANLQLQASAAPHGLNELTLCTVRHPGRQPPALLSALDPLQSRTLYARLLKMEFLGAMAMGLGVLLRGRELAQDYAAIRRQGGAVIERHAAVQQMLSDIDGSCRLVERLLHSFAQPLDEIELGDVVAARGSSSDALLRASHQVIQTYGGIGYMRDAGPEKLARDQQMLRQYAGGVQALPLFLHSLRELH
jgi:hypothetical protein